MRTKKLTAIALALVCLLASALPSVADTDVSGEIGLDGLLSLDTLMELNEGEEEKPEDMAQGILGARIAAQEPDAYTVTYVDAEGDTLLQESFAPGSLLPAPADLAPTLDNHTFLGWDTAFPIANLRSDLTISALFSPWPTASFVAWVDGEKTLLHSEQMAPGSAVTYGGDTPTRAGFTFEGWKPQLEGATLTRDMEFTAQFVGNEIYRLTVYYTYADGTAAAQPEVRTLLYGDSYTIASPEVLGFMPDIATIEGTVDGETTEIEHVVTYAVSTGTPYSVTHHLRKAGRPITDAADPYDPDDYTVADTETFASMEGAIVTVTSNEYEGFSLHNTAKTYRVAADGSTEIHLFYTRNTYAIEFDTDGGSFADPIVGEYGMVITAGSAPTKPGYIFTGWDEPLPSTMPAQNIVRTATWKTGTAGFKVARWLQNADDDGYTYYDVVEFKNATVGSTINPDTLSLGSINYFTYDPVKTAEKSWTVEGDGTTIVQAFYSRNRYTVVFDIASSSSASAMEIGGKRYEPGATGSNRYSFTVRYDQDISSLWPTASNFPETANGKAFVGWKTDGSSTTFASKRLTLAEGLFNTSGGEKVMNAQFDTSYVNALHYKVESLTQAEGEGRFKSGNIWYDEDMALSQVLNNNSNTADSWSAKTITGVTAVSSKGVDTPTGDAYRIASADVNVSFYYTRNSYVIQFHNQGEAVVNSKSIKFGAPIKGQFITPQAPAALAARGFTFGGWYGEASCADESAIDWDTAVMPAGNMPAYAKWVPPSYDVTCTAEGGYVHEQSVIEGGYAEAPADEPVRDGFTFLGWYIKDTTVPFHFDKQKITRAFELVALWAPRTDVTYEVRYQHGDALLDGPENPVTHEMQRAGDTITEDAPVIEGYLADYRSKSLSLAGSGNVLAFQYVPYDAIDYTVEYHVLNADGTIGDEIADAETRPFTGRVPVASEKAKRIPGYTPEVWNEQKMLTANPEENTFVFLYTPNEGATYTVIYWRENADGTYTEDGQETVTMDAAPVGSTVTAALPEDGAPAGYTLDEGGSRLTGYVQSGGGLTLIVRYARETYTVTYALVEGAPAGLAIAGQTQTHHLGDAVTLPPDPSVPSSHTFGGWQLPEGLEADEDGVFTMPDEDITITGLFTPRTLSIAFGDGDNGSLTGDTAYGDIPWGASWEEIVEALPTPVPSDGYYFLGWDAAFPATLLDDFTVTPLFVTVMPITLVAEGGELVYNGQEQIVEGFTVSGLDDTDYSAETLTFEGITAGGRGTNAGEYDVTFSGQDALVIRYTGEADAARYLAENQDITERFTVSGYEATTFTILPRPVTLTTDPLSILDDDLRAQIAVAVDEGSLGLIGETDLGDITYRVEGPGGPDAPIKVGDTVIITPIFEDNPNYDITAEPYVVVVKGEIRYDANLPSGAPGTYTQPGQLALGETATLLSPGDMGFTADGYTFDGWATAPGGPAVYAPGDGLTMGPDSPRFYGVWTKNPDPTALPTAEPTPTAKPAAAKATEPPAEIEADGETYALTVRYILADKGTSISAPTMIKLAAGEPYSIEPMASVMFEATVPALTGTMPAENTTITFEYAVKQVADAAVLLDSYDPANPPEAVVAARNRTAPSVFVVAVDDITQQTSMSSRNLGDCGF